MIKRNYTYKKFSDAPIASELDRIINKQSTTCFFLFDFVPFIFFVMPGSMIYNMNGHKKGIVSTILILLGCIFFMLGGIIIRVLNQKFELTKKIAEKESKHSQEDAVILKDTYVTRM